jgi:ABC-type sugar transport system ATPase subunit
MQDIGKRFSGAIARNGIDLEVCPGEIAALADCVVVLRDGRDADVLHSSGHEDRR